MPTPLRISITKEILARCVHCGKDNQEHLIPTTCAVATALMEMFPQVYVTSYFIFPFGIDHRQEQALRIPLPLVAQQFIQLFDGFTLTPNLRLLLPEFDFTIDVPDEVVEQINIDELTAWIASKNLPRAAAIAA